MTTHDRQIIHAWLTAARHTSSTVVRRIAMANARRRAERCQEPNHIERIRTAATTHDLAGFRHAVDVALNWLAVEMKVSSHDFGEGSGIGFKHILRVQ